MYNSKILIGNSGDKVFLQGNKVIKEAGHYPEKFKQQMDFLFQMALIIECSYTLLAHQTQ